MAKNKKETIDFSEFIGTYTIDEAKEVLKKMKKKLKEVTKTKK